MLSIRNSGKYWVVSLLTVIVPIVIAAQGTAHAGVLATPPLFVSQGTGEASECMVSNLSANDHTAVITIIDQDGVTLFSTGGPEPLLAGATNGAAFSAAAQQFHRCVFELPGVNGAANLDATFRASICVANPLSPDGCDAALEARPVLPIRVRVAPLR